MKKKHKILIPILIVLFIIIIIAVSAVIYYNVSLKSVSSKSEEIVVEIKKGWSNSDIAEQLKEKGLINNAFTFKIYTKLNKVSGMQAGTYKLNKNMDAEQIIDALKKGSTYYPETIDITFLEGKNMRWIAKTIAAKTNNSENDVYAKLKDKDYLNTLIDKYGIDSICFFPERPVGKFVHGNRMRHCRDIHRYAAFGLYMRRNHPCLFWRIGLRFFLGH